MKRHLGYVLYGIVSVVESLVNMVLYTTFLYKFVPVLDISMPFYFKYCDKFLKGEYLESIR